MIADLDHAQSLVRKLETFRVFTLQAIHSREFRERFRGLGSSSETFIQSECLLVSLQGRRKFFLCDVDRADAD